MKMHFKTFLLAALAVVTLASVASSVPHSMVGGYANKKPYAGHQVLTFNLHDEESVQTLKSAIKDHRLDVWSHGVGLGKVDVNVGPSFDAKSLGIDYTVKVADLQSLIKEESRNFNPFGKGRVASAKATSFFSAYHDNPTNLQWLTSLAASTPYTEIVDVGTTYNNNKIKALHIHKAPAGSPAVYIEGTIHAREWVSTMVVNYAASLLVPGNTTDTAAFINKYEFFIVPVANVDGFIYTHSSDRLFRKNVQPNHGSSCLGTDPNRNFGFQWGTGGASTDPCADDYQGPSALSTPEASSITKFIKNHTNIKVLIDFHSYSQLWMVPWGYTCDNGTPDDSELTSLAAGASDALSKLYGTQFQSGDICTTIYQASGNSVDFSYNAGVKYSFAVELRDTGDYGFVLPANQILPSGKETWAGIDYILKNVNL